ncbi:hypothetical protein K2F45_07070 [Sphingobacterium siyangense]|uniref:hypothetical protein n=1 Tax=Sphingobacterium siyangense TaxID=459529 RepID=UPI0020100C0F|nr:hypothetical protein [Sphingobacterium siyangense]UQA76748.1 hypothetical protein K2F45_07070 [Sphingobacterium siyangense]
MNLQLEVEQQLGLLKNYFTDQEYNGMIKQKFQWYVFMLVFFLLGCSQDPNFDNTVMREFQQCKSNNGCILDMEKAFDFDWDTVYYFSGKYSLDEINEILGFNLRSYTDVGARFIFVYKGRDVYSYEWFPSSDNLKENVYMLTDLDLFKVDRHNAKFSIEKIDHKIFVEHSPFSNARAELLKIKNQ